MVVVDSSVWIANLRQVDSSAVRKLQSIEDTRNILVGDYVLLEVLQGARDDRHAEKIEQRLRKFEIVNILDESLAVLAASHYRLLRQHGITIRKAVDVIIATFCIAGGHQLLHDDRDFVGFERHCGLQIL